MKMPGRSQARRSGAAPWLARSFSRLLALCAALLVGVGLWAPWLVATSQPTELAPPLVVPVGAARGLPVALTLIFGAGSFGDVSSRWFPRAVILITWLIIVLAALGLLLVPLLWLRRGTRRRLLALAAYALWLTLCTITPVALIAGILLALRRLSRLVVSDISWSAGWGLVPLTVGLLLGWTALILLLPNREPAESSAPVRRAEREDSRRQLYGAFVYAAGVVVWGAGFLAVPWATVNCAVVPLSLNHFVEGACAGLDAGDALSALVASHVEPTGWDWYNGIYALYGLLLGGGALALVAIWRGARAPAIRLWLAAWLLVASTVTMLSYRGVAHIAAEAPVLAIQATGIWRGGPGIPLAFSGQLIAWLGLLLLDGVSRGAPSPAPALPVESVTLPLSPETSPARP